MAIDVVCECGKRFKTGEQFAGKRTKCPACGRVLVIPGTVAAAVAAAPSKPSVAPKVVAPKSVAKAVSRPAVRVTANDGLDEPLDLSLEAEVFQPAPRAEIPATTTRSAKSTPPTAGGIPLPPRRGGTPSSGSGPSIAVSPKIAILIALAVIIPMVFFWAEHGPIKTQRDWKELSPKAESDVLDVVTRAIRNKYITAGIDLNHEHFQPGAKSIFFDEPVIMFSMPESMVIQGNSTEGKFHGFYHPGTGEIEADIPLSLNPSETIHATGRNHDGKIEVEVNGKPLGPNDF